MNDNMTRAETDAAIEQMPGERVTHEHIESIITDIAFYDRGTSLTICVLTVLNGFTVIGESACVDPTNYDVNIGRSIARRHAFEKLWLLEGYALAERRRVARELVESFAANQPTLPAGMALYIGTKCVAAGPGTDAHGADGYAVIYADGYESWSPAEPFEAAYTRYRG